MREWSTFEKYSADDLNKLKRLFNFIGKSGTVKATALDYVLDKNPGTKEALADLIARGAITKKGDDYVWDRYAALAPKAEGMARLRSLVF